MKDVAKELYIRKRELGKKKALLLDAGLSPDEEEELAALTLLLEHREARFELHRRQEEFYQRFNGLEEISMIDEPDAAAKIAGKQEAKVRELQGTYDCRKCKACQFLDCELATAQTSHRFFASNAEKDRKWKLLLKELRESAVSSGAVRKPRLDDFDDVAGHA